MNTSGPHESYNLDIQTPAGNLAASVSVPTGFIPLTDILPLMRSLGEQAQQLEIDNTTQTGDTISCQKGCAACCRMMIPVAPPEAFALLSVVEALPSPKKERLLERFQAAQEILREAGLEDGLQRLAFSEHQGSDEELEPLNRAYYALRMPCPFLENEICSIYEQRPSACRELLVTSPAELCQDVIQNPVNLIPSPFRIGTVLSKLWADCYQGPIRLIPLPFALDWAKAHESQTTRTWAGPELLSRALDAATQYLQRRSS
ncbi:MAG TPA: YkgJ family cysteine cluster protein [Nitrospirales bacterium]|nr:YkgJ family cysteine cluster protein [Nitrospirales bacterium]